MNIFRNIYDRWRSCMNFSGILSGGGCCKEEIGETFILCCMHP